MDFFSIVFFLILYYVRPHEWISWVAALKPVMLCMAVAIFAMFNREKPFTFKDIFKTPHDWMMLIYFVWVVAFAPNPLEALGKCYNLFAFYIVTVQALSNIQRLQKFLNWWTFLILTVATLALLSEVGFDPTGSYEMTHGLMKNRLVFNTSLFNNPNSLGHSVVPCLMMLYYVCYWKRPIFSKIATIPLVLLALYCIYLTVSKGSFISAFASLVLAYSFGRPKMVQIVIVVLAVSIGSAAMYALPRMNELRKGRSDPAIQGRIAAWQFGLEVMKKSNTGVGLGRFMDEFFKKHHYGKAGHSSYVQLGAETGYTGLFIYLGILYCGIRTLAGAKTTTDEEERVRRTLFVLICSYIVSSWMVDFGFRATYFLTIAGIAAFHRQMLLKSQPAATKEKITEIETAPIAIGFPQWRPVGATPALMAKSVSQMTIDVPASPSTEGGTRRFHETPEPEKGGMMWTRIGIFDVIMMFVLLWGALQFWRYAMTHI